MAAIWAGVGGHGGWGLGIFTELVHCWAGEVAALKRCLASWAKRRGGFVELELVAGQGGWQGRGWGWGEELLAQAMLACIGCGVKPGVAHAALLLWG